MSTILKALCNMRRNTLLDAARAICPLCAQHVPHHTNAGGSIGGGDRHPIYDLHAVEDAGGVGLAECTAYAIWRLME